VVDEETGEVTAVSYRHSEQLDQLFAALCKAQAVFEAAEKSGDNPHFRSKYATLESALEATKKGRSENGLCVLQLPCNIQNAIGVTTLLGHSSGQWIESTIAIPPFKFDAQGAGSVVTYLRRYSLMAILGVAAEDDDGEGAVAGAGERREPPRTVPPATRQAPKPAPPVHDDASLEALGELIEKVELAQADPALIFRQFKVDRWEDLHPDDLIKVHTFLDNRLTQMRKQGKLKLQPNENR
jgi:hypothetical protein